MSRKKRVKLKSITDDLRGCCRTLVLPDGRTVFECPFCQKTAASEKVISKQKVLAFYLNGRENLQGSCRGCHEVIYIPVHPFLAKFLDIHSYEEHCSRIPQIMQIAREEYEALPVEELNKMTLLAHQQFCVDC